MIFPVGSWVIGLTREELSAKGYLTCAEGVRFDLVSGKKFKVALSESGGIRLHGLPEQYSDWGFDCKRFKSCTPDYDKETQPLLITRYEYCILSGILESIPSEVKDARIEKLKNKLKELKYD